MMIKNGIQDSVAFTGKERDSETGYGYFGARYMDHELMTMWLSVDPLADKYPSISPYNYCMWNPMKIVDEYGMEADIPPLLAKFCSAERQANSFLNNPKRKGRFVRNTISSIDADGRETITVKPNSNYVDKYDAPSPSDGILLPTVYVTDKGLDNREFTDGDIYHFFHSLGKKIHHFENNLLPHTDCGLSGNIDWPDMVAIELNASVASPAIGGEGSFMIGYIFGEGSFNKWQTGLPVGIDVSASVNIHLGYYSGSNKPSNNSLNGASWSTSISSRKWSFGFSSCKNWDLFSVGYGVSATKKSAKTGVTITY